LLDTTIQADIDNIVPSFELNLQIDTTKVELGVGNLRNRLFLAFLNEDIIQRPLGFACEISEVPAVDLRENDDGVGGTGNGKGD
jgi:hypothetical protein